MKLAYLREFWDDYCIKAEVTIDPILNPSMLYAGESGSGKSTAVKYNLFTLLESEMHEDRKVDVWFMNYKDSNDFKFLKKSNYPRYFCGQECDRGFEKFYEYYGDLRANKGEDIDHMTIMIFDEYPAFILKTQMDDRKRAEMYMKNLGEILMTGRSYKVGCWITSQRPDAAYFANGAREQFHVRIMLTRGVPSKESLIMMGFAKEDFNEEMYRAGEGIAFIDGKGLYEIKYPKYSSESIDNAILDGLSWAR